MAARGRILLLICSFPVSLALSQTGTSPFNADSLFFDGLRLFRLGETEEARVRFRVLLNAYPRYHDARILYGRILSWDKDYRSAITQFDSVLFFQPGNREARFAKAQTYAWSGRYRSAADILHALTEEAPASASYWLQLANVYFWGGSPRKALEYYERAYIRDPLSQDILRGLARVHRRLRSNELSLRWYRKLLERVPGDFEALGEIMRQTYRSNHEVQIQGVYESFVKPEITEHTIAQVEYYVAANEDWKPFLHYSRVSKFSEHDNRFGGGSYVTLDYSVSVLAQVLLAPNARIAPQVDALADVTVPVVSGIELTGGYRYLKFDSLHVHVPSPAVTLFLSNRSWLTVRGYFGFGSDKTSSTATTATAFFLPTPFTTIRAGVFTGNETFRATTFQEIASLRSSGGLFGFKSRISQSLALDAQYQFTSRTRLSNSHLIQLAVSFLF